jgi:hypothetical protein
MKNQITHTVHAGSWREYNRSLCERGSLIVWIDPACSDLWSPPEPTGRRGRPQRYCDDLVVALLTLKEVFHQKYRQTIGLVASILKLAGIERTLPDYSTLSRRAKTVSVPLKASERTQPVHLLIDSTGVKLAGEGEWKTCLYGTTRYRSWRKLHLVCDRESLEILSMCVSDSSDRDHEHVEELIGAIDRPIDDLAADGAYDKAITYEVLQRRGAWPIIPPWTRAKIWRHGNRSGPPLPRDVNLRYIRRHGRRAWRDFSGYHRRSLVETQMSRIKLIFGDRLTTRRAEAQATQARIRCATLNRMTQLGLPPVAQA